MCGLRIKNIIRKKATVILITDYFKGCSGAIAFYNIDSKVHPGKLASLEYHVKFLTIQPKIFCKVLQSRIFEIIDPIFLIVIVYLIIVAYAGYCAIVLRIFILKYNDLFDCFLFRHFHVIRIIVVFISDVDTFTGQAVFISIYIRNTLRKHKAFLNNSVKGHFLVILTEVVIGDFTAYDVVNGVPIT